MNTNSICFIWLPLFFIQQGSLQAKKTNSKNFEIPIHKTLSDLIFLVSRISLRKQKGYKQSYYFEIVKLNETTCTKINIQTKLLITFLDNK